MPDDETARKVSIDYTLAAARAFAQNVSNQQGKKFRFVYVSGGMAERDQKKPLWFAQSYRRIRVSYLSLFYLHSSLMIAGRS